MMLKKPEIAKIAEEQGTHRSLVKEILIFILVFFIGSLVAGIIPAIYEMYVMLTDADIMDRLEAMLISGRLSYTDMVDLVLDMNDAMYILTLLCTIIVIVTVVIYCRKIEHRSLKSMGFVRENAVKHYLTGILVGFASFTLCFLLGIVSGCIHVDGINPKLNLGIVLLYIVGFMIQSLSEEVTFRGYFMISLMKKNSALKAVLINAFAFALCHILNPGLSVIAMINLMMIGVFLSVYVLVTNDIWGAAAYHFMWNFAQGALYGVSVSGTKVLGAVLSTTVDETPAILSGGIFGTEGSIFTTIVMGGFLAIMIYINKRKIFAD
jgi:hypothetical protein